METNDRGCLPEGTFRAPRGLGWLEGLGLGWVASGGQGCQGSKVLPISLRYPEAP